MKTISLAMIVKNEAEIINECLKRVKDYVQEIIIVDTGSQDDTVEIARNYTDLIYSTDWEDDYSKARNYANSFAKCDYILNLDADELIIDHNFFEDFQNSTEEFFKGYFFNCKFTQYRNFDYDYYYSKRLEAMQYESSRIILFKNSGEYKYHGYIHETLTDGNGNQPVTSDNVFLKVLHAGSLERRDFKSHYYNRLGIKQLESPDRCNNRDNLAINLLHYYIKCQDEGKFNETFIRFREDFLSERTCQHYIRAVKKLFVMKQYKKAKTMLEHFRHWANIEYLKDEEIKLLIDGRYCFFSDIPYNCQEAFNEVLSEKIKEGNRLQYAIKSIILDVKNFETGEHLLEAVKTAFIKGFDFIEINISLNQSFIENPYLVLEEISKYPVICNISIDYDIEDNYLEKLELLKIKIGYIFIRFELKDLNLCKLTSALEKYRAITKNFYVRAADAKLLSDFDKFKVFLKELTDYTDERQFGISLEGIPYCLMGAGQREIMRYSKDIDYLNDKLTSDSCKKVICDCYLWELCENTCHKVAEGLQESSVLIPVRNVTMLLKKKLELLKINLAE